MPEQHPNVEAAVTTDATDATGATDALPQVEDVLVEEVSIDGMCGVY